MKAERSVMKGLSSLWVLEGVWHLKRDIVHAAGDTHHLTGEVTFYRDDVRLVQDERGTLDIGGQRLTAMRRYIWVEGAGGLDVFFDDMRAFHSVALNVATHSAVHLCDPDRYEVAYDFTDWLNWSACWRVTGPRKDYVMTSHYTPKSDSLAP
ncbi:MAG: DUF6314 family protein [Paracoccaceae bacterium]